MYVSRVIPALFLGIALVASGCGGGGESASDEAADQEMESEEPAVSEDAQLAMEIGPVKEPVVLGDYDAALAAQGQTSFETRCVACHRLDEVFIGPAIGNVLDRRQPVYVMNMIMNPEGMLANHPTAKALLVEYNNVPMVGMGVERDEARAIVEYFRGGE